MSTSTALSVNKKGFAHIFILLIILAVVIVAILIFLGMQASKTLNLAPNQKTQYQNPFDQQAKYENPFDDYQNPFDQIEQ